MRIAILPADTGGCGVYRLGWSGQAVAEARPDWEVTIYQPDAVQIATDNATGKFRAVRGLHEPETLDLIIMQRIGYPSQVKFIQWAVNQGIAVVTDTDDAMWAIHQDNTSWAVWNRRGPREMHWRWTDVAAQNADLTTVTTKALQDRYGRHGRSEIIPNFVPSNTADISSIRNQFSPELSIGWAGYIGTHPHDLQVCGGAVRDSGAVVRVLGDGGGAGRAWGLSEGSVDTLPSVPLGIEYYQALTSIDVALVPLESSRFNSAKSNLKALEYSAMGVPVIASDTPAIRDLQNSGVPLLIAKNEAEWNLHIRRLLDSDSERADRGEEARRVVSKNWTVEGNVDLWINAWQRAVNRRRQLNR